MLYMYKFEIVFPHTRPHVWPAFCLCLSSLTTLGCSRWAVDSQVQLGYCSRIAGPWSWRWRWRYQMYICLGQTSVFVWDMYFMYTDRCYTLYQSLPHAMSYIDTLSIYSVHVFTFWLLYYSCVCEFCDVFNLFCFYLYFTPKAPVFRRTRGSDVS